MTEPTQRDELDRGRSDPRGADPVDTDAATPRVDPLRPALAAVARRVRAQRALDAAVVFGWVAVGVAGVAVGLLKAGALPEAEALLALQLALALPLVGAIGGALRRIDALLPARLIDRSHGLRERVANAVAFDGLSERTPLMDAAIRDANERASSLSAARAMPLRAPIDLAGIAGLAVGVGLLGMLEVPRTVEERVLVGGIDPVTLHADDLDAYESELRDLLEARETPDDVRDAAQDFNRLIEDLADERLDRAESLRRIAELERQLAEARPADAETMRESLRELGEDLRRAELADQLSAALRDGDASQAERELRRLAERTRSDEASRRELEALRRALARAAEERTQELSEELQRQEEAQRRLLQRQREQPDASPRERRLLQRRQRELERLRREHQEAMDRQRQLERLRRELNEAAEGLNQQQQEQAAEHMERGAEDLNRMARQQMSDEQLQRLQRQLQELRELIRRQRQQQAQGQGQRGQGQQGQGGQGQSQMDRFVLRARGQGDGQGVRLGVPGQQGQQGQGGPQGQQPGQGQQGQGQDGQGQNGQGQGQGQQPMLTLGGEGEPNALVEIPGMGQGQQPGQGSGQAQLGPGAGTGHDPTQLDDPTRLGGTRRTVRVEGEQRDGPSRSQTILSSAERGFASQDYEDVYTDYENHAEEVLEQDEIPPGRRFWIRRYFQLIRPR